MERAGAITGHRRQWSGLANGGTSQIRCPVATSCRSERMVSTKEWDGSTHWLRKKCQVLRTRGLTGLDNATLSRTSSLVSNVGHATGANRGSDGSQRDEGGLLGVFVRVPSS
jgi:hypothetical protein